MFAHWLVAHGIGGRTVDELSTTMDPEEFLRWGVYRALEPFGDDRADWRNAMVLWQQANLHRSKGSSALPVSRFLLTFEKGLARRKSIEDLRAAMDAHLIHGGGKLPQS